jgi:hypothetical protein
MTSLLILIGIAFIIALIATPFLIAISLFHKYTTWFNKSVNGGKSKDEEAMEKIVKRLLKK